MGSVLGTIEEVGLSPTMYHYLPMLRSAEASWRGDVASAVGDLAEAAASEQRTSSPFLATDVYITVAHTAFCAGEFVEGVGSRGGR